MSGKHNFIFSLEGEQKSFFISNMEVAQFCRLLRSAFDVERTITALQDAQGNIWDLQYFCQNLHAHRDKFYIVLSEQRKRQNQRSSYRQQKQNKQTIEEESSYLIDFQTFLKDIQQIRFSTQHPVLTIVLVFDNQYQAEQLGQHIIKKIYKTFAYLQAYYTIVQDEESDTLLLTLFENSILKNEVEIRITNTIQDDVCLQIEQLMNEEEDEQQSQPFLNTQQQNQNINSQFGNSLNNGSSGLNNIPLIVTRGNEKTILQVEPNDNFHSSQGKRTHGVMRVKKAVEKFRSQFESKEYEYILGLIIGQDQSVFAAYQLYQKTQNDENFIKNLRQLLPNEDTNNISFQNNMKFITSPLKNDVQQQFQYDQHPTPVLRSSENILEQLISYGELDQIESGMIKELRMESELHELIKSLIEQPIEILSQIIKQYLKSKFLQELSANFNPLQSEYILQESTNKLSPIYLGFLKFSHGGQIQELFNMIKECIGNFNDQVRMLNTYSYYLTNKKQYHIDDNFHFHINGIEDQQNDRKTSVDQQALENKKEINFIDKYHLKELQKYSDEDYEKLHVTVYDQCGKFCDEHEKAKLHKFFKQKNQRLQYILDKFGQTYDINVIKSDLIDLLTLQNNNIDNIQSPTHGEFIEPKMHKYKNFKFLVQFLYEVDKVITMRQAKTFYYLYSIEEMSLMAAYEVYSETKDQDEFLDTLNLIYKVYSSSTRFDFNEIEQFDALIEQQLSILFAYRRFFNQEERLALEQNFRSGENTLLKLFRDFLKNKDQKVFIEKSSELAKAYIEKQKYSEQKDPLQKMIEMNSYQKEVIMDLCSKYMKNKIKQVDLLMEAIDQDNTMIRSSIEVYELTLDKQDFVENVELIYNHIMKNNIRSILKANLIELGKSKTDLTNLLRRINQDEPILKGAFELYFQTKDEAELKDTIARILKFSNI